jgi:mono/diheme cytochrome c family protein
MRKLPIISLLLVALTVIAVSCSDVKRNRGKVYMPDMADSRAYETYSASPIFADGQTNREPVAGTVKRGELLPFHLAKDKTGDTANYFASKLVKSPIGELSDDDKKEAERLYLINCGICHGPKLDGNGPLWKDGDGPFPSKPAQLVGDARYENMPEGQMFYSVTYGKNLMGSYASQLDRKQRWMVIAYIKSKQSKPAATVAVAAAPAKDSAAAKVMTKTTAK